MTSEPDWRTRHCAEPVVEHVEKVTGKKLWRKLGGVPRSPKQAAALYRKLGVTNLKGAVTAVLGEPIRPAFAMRNDVAMVDNALGIVRGEWVECFDRMQPIERAECAWRVNKG